MASLYIPVQKIDENIIRVDSPCLTLHYILKFISALPCKVTYVEIDDFKSDWFPIKTKHFSWEYSFTQFGKILPPISYSNLPSLLINRDLVVTGLCAVLRAVIKLTSSESDDDKLNKILGFRGGCLSQCSEVSLWTKYCEYDVLIMMKQVLKSPKDENGTASLIIPDEVGCLESHLRQPVRMHNINKLKHIMKQNKSEQIDVLHSFVDGPDLSLSDLMLYPSFYLWFSWVKNYEDVIIEYFPNIMKWYNNMCMRRDLQPCSELFEVILPSVSPFSAGLPVTVGEVKNSSLYKRDPNRYKPRWKLFTKQDDVSRVLSILQSSRISPLEMERIKEATVSLADIMDVIPVSGGHLPLERHERKCQQIFNIVNAVVQIARPGDMIVDFCSGSGHVGITIASILPNCKVILVENKEESLSRARQRVEHLGLCNVSFLQCNLNYFVGNFDIGVCLHGCGVATDLVLSKCLEKQASFVVAPCCYGAIHNTNTICYPRSEEFQGVKFIHNDYIVICHSADQTKTTKDIQGKLCMALVDTDRLLLAKSCGYKVSLHTMVPAECTPKNHVLVGVKL